MVNLAEMYREFEKDNLDCINFRHLDSGVMRCLIERFPEDDTIRQWAEHFIRVNGAEIENLMGEIEYDRRTARKIEELQRG